MDEHFSSNREKRLCWFSPVQQLKLSTRNYIDGTVIFWEKVPQFIQGFLLNSEMKLFIGFCHDL